MRQSMPATFCANDVCWLVSGLFLWHERAGMRSLPDGFRMYEARLPNGSDYIDLQFYFAPCAPGGAAAFSFIARQGSSWLGEAEDLARRE